MLTIDALKEFGADTEGGLTRCMNNEPFYLKLVKKAAEKDDLEQLKQAVSEADLDRAFELCHSMKGVYGNLSLTPLFTPAREMTELLRVRKQTDYSGYLSELTARMEELRRISAE